MTAEQSADRVHITRIIDAPREEVFRAWTAPEQIRRWWGPGEFTCRKLRSTCGRGGGYRLAMQPTEGDAFIVGGTYREVDLPTRLLYTWRWETGPAADGSESLVSVEFNDRGEQTELVLTHTAFPASHGPAPYQMGWEGGLQKFEALFAGSSVDA
jgi:uncharacterized protein YndB with AHSA1/START domain